MTDDEDPEELQDGFSLPSKSDGLTNFFAGAESTDELGDHTVEIHTTEGIKLVFDSVLMCEVAGTPVVICKDAIRSDDGCHLVPTNVIPWRDVRSIAIPMEDGRLESIDAERIGVNK